MPEPGLWAEPVELRHGFQHPSMITSFEPLHALCVGGGGLRSEDVINACGFMFTQFTQRPEGVAECPGSQQHDFAVARGDAVAQRSPKA
jgi:hypothetical protein